MSTPLPIQAESYAQLRDKLADLPMTWYPDLIRTVIEAALAKGSFHPIMGASEFVRSVEAEWRKKHRTGASCPSCSVSKR